MKISAENTKQEKWIRWMEWGTKIGCHQKPERSFFPGGYQMPVCARCTGVFIGYMVGIAALFAGSFRYRKGAAFTGCLIMFLDWFVQAVKLKESTNRRRFVTGMLGGFGALHFFAALFAFVKQKF